MITVLTGSNDFARRAELTRLVTDFVAEHGDLALERIDGSEIELGRLLDSVASLPFLSARRLLVLDEPGKNKAIAENIDKVLEAVDEATHLVIVEPKPDKRLSYYKTIAKKTELKVFNELDGRELAQWLSTQAGERGGELKTGDAAYLIERVGANQLALSNELDKLLLYEPTISRQTIDLLTEPAPQSTIFELLDAAFAGNHKRAMQLYREQRALKVEPQQIIAMLAWQLHVLAVVKAAGRRDPNEIAKEAHLNPFVVRKTFGIANKLTMGQVKDLVRRTLELDIRLKSEAIDADDALQHLLLTL